jgi:bifunctional non-homologous end joining protein LigD
MAEPLLPQQPTPARAEIASVEWLFEPFWPGDRLIVAIGDGVAAVTDDHGELAGAELRDVGELVRSAVRAERAVVDGVWTAQPFLAEEPEADRRAFVAVDLLELEGESLLDVPLQERRRLLESVVDERAQVRVSPAVKQPIGGWLLGWRANGFTHYVAKHQNSRYAPGQRTDEWLKVDLHVPASSGFVARLVGSRERVRRIRD